MQAGGTGPSANGTRGSWRIVTTPAFNRWLEGLDAERSAQVRGGLNRVSAGGPSLGRPRVDSINGSRLHNLKELRLRNGIRVLFAFNPNREAVMLVGGDKTGSWDRWYVRKIAVAERLYADHLRSMGRVEPCLIGLERPQRSVERDR
jgi:hypothetical protein